MLNQFIIGSGNNLLPFWQTFIRTNVDLLTIGTLVNWSVNQNMQILYQTKCICKCHLQNVIHFVQTSMCIDGDLDSFTVPLHSPNCWQIAFHKGYARGLSVATENLWKFLLIIWAHHLLQLRQSQPIFRPTNHKSGFFISRSSRQDHWKRRHSGKKSLEISCPWLQKPLPKWIPLRRCFFLWHPYFPFQEWGFPALIVMVTICVYWSGVTKRTNRSLTQLMMTPLLKRDGHCDCLVIRNTVWDCSDTSCDDEAFIMTIVQCQWCPCWFNASFVDDKFNWQLLTIHLTLSVLNSYEQQ